MQEQVRVTEHYYVPADQCQFAVRIRDRPALGLLREVAPATAARRHASVKIAESGRAAAASNRMSIGRERAARDRSSCERANRKRGHTMRGRTENHRLWHAGIRGAGRSAYC